MVDYNKLVGTRTMGDYGGEGTKSWEREQWRKAYKDREKIDQIESGSLSNAVKKKQIEKTTQKLKDSPMSELSEKQEAGLGIAEKLTAGMGDGGSSAGGAMEGAASGAVMGAKFGPQGAVVGAVAGGIMGIMGARSKRKQRRREAEAQAQGHLASGEAQRSKAYGRLRDSMSSAFATASNRKQTAQL